MRCEIGSARNFPAFFILLWGVFEWFLWIFSHPFGSRNIPELGLDHYIVSLWLTIFAFQLIVFHTKIESRSLDLQDEVLSCSQLRYFVRITKTDGWYAYKVHTAAGTWKLPIFRFWRNLEIRISIHGFRHRGTRIEHLSS